MNSNNSSEQQQQQPKGAGQSSKSQKPLESEETIRTRRQFTILFVAALVASFLPLPFRMVAVLFSLWALVVAVIAIAKTWRSDTPNQNLFSLVSGAVVALIITLLIGSTATRWQLDMDYQTCQRQAITHSAMQKCTDQYQKDLKEATTGVINQ